MVNDNVDSTNNQTNQIQCKEENIENSRGNISEESSSVDSNKNTNIADPIAEKSSDKGDESEAGKSDLNISDQSGKTSLFCSVPLNKIRSVLSYVNNKNDEDDTKLKQISRKLLCLYCDRTFVSSNLRQKHVERCHSEKQSRRLSSRKLQSQFTTTACFHCDKLPVEHSLKQLFEHLISNHSQKYFGCLNCEERFLNQSLLNDHNAKLHGDSSTSKWQKTNSIVKSQKEIEIQDEIISESSNLNGVETEPNQKLTRSATREKAATPPTKPQLRNKKLTIKASKIGSKRSKRLQAAQAKVPVQKKRTKPVEAAKTEETSTKSSEKAKNSSVNPYPEFDNYYRVKKITDHSIDNLKISSLTFDDVFDKAFFNRIKCNIQENLLYHLDGKLFKNEESESRISNFEKNPPSQDVPSTSSENFGCDLSLNAITPVTSILSSNFGEDLESQIEYGAKPSKKKLQTRQDPVRHKYVTRRKYQASILEHKENRDLSKLDMWTQLIIKDRQQKVLNDQKSAKEMLEYTTCAEYKLKVQRNELNRILDRRGPFEDLKEESTKMAALDKLNSGTNNKVSEECFKEVRSVLDELIDEVVRICSTNDEQSNIIVKSEGSASQAETLTTPELPDYLKLRISSSVPSEEEIDKSDKISLICSSQETENFELPTNTVRAKHEMIELSGEWARSRIYVCAACGLKLPNMKFLLDHKSLYHQNAWVQHYEFVGNQSELYRHLCIPGLGKVGHVEKSVQCKSWRRSEARMCSKCGKVCNALAELHRHILECGGDWTWMLARKKCKYRPFGSRKKRRGLVKRIRERINNPKTEQPEKKKLKKPFEGPRQRPSDADTIERMLANLPPKRSSRKIICLKDGFPRNLKKPNNSSRVMKCGKVVMKKSNYEENKTSTSNHHKNVSVKRTLRSLNRTLSSKILDTTSKLKVKRQLIKNINNRSNRQSTLKIVNASTEDVRNLQEIESKKGANVGKNKIGKDTDRVKHILKEKMNIKNFFPVTKRKASKNVQKNEQPLSTQSLDEKNECKTETNKSSKSSVKKFIKKSFGLQKKDETINDNKNIKGEVAIKEPLQSGEKKPAKLSNKRKLRSSFRKVIDKVKKLKLDNSNTTESNRDATVSNSFLGQGTQGKEKLATVLIPLVEEVKENPPSIPAFVQNAIDNNSPTEESLIPENIFNLEHSLENLLQAKSPLESSMSDVMISGSKTALETPTETKFNEIKTDDPSAEKSIRIIETDVKVMKNFNKEKIVEEIISNVEEKENIENVEITSSSPPDDSKKMSLLSIETSAKSEKSPLVSPLISPSILSPKMKGKLRKPNRGLNDCIAMLTKKAFEEKKVDTPEVIETEEIEEAPIQDNKNTAHKFVRENECILKIPIFERESRKNIQNEVLDLSKPKTSLNSEKKDAIDLSTKISQLWSPMNNSNRITPNMSMNAATLFNFWNPSTSLFPNTISEKAILKIPKITETSWTSVDDIIEKVVENRCDPKFQKPISKISPGDAFNSVDRVIEYVVKGDSRNISKDISTDQIESTIKTNVQSKRKSKKKSDSDDTLIISGEKELLSSAQQRLENLGKIIEKVATLPLDIDGANPIPSVDIKINLEFSDHSDNIMKESTECSRSSPVLHKNEVEESPLPVTASISNDNQTQDTSVAEETTETNTRSSKNTRQKKKRTTRNSSKNSKNSKGILSDTISVEQISQTLVNCVEIEPEILEDKKLEATSITQEVILQNEINNSSVTAKDEESVVKDTTDEKLNESPEEKQELEFLEYSKSTQFLKDSELIEDEPIILEEKTVEENDVLLPASTDSEDELPLVVFKNKIDKVENADETANESIQKSVKNTENAVIPEQNEENEGSEENIPNSLNELITGELPFSSDPSKKEETHDEQETESLKLSTTKQTQSKKSHHKKNTTRRKSLRKSSSVEGIAAISVQSERETVTESRRSMLVSDSKDDQEGDKDANISDDVDIQLEEKEIDDIPLINEEPEIDQNSTPTLPILRVTKIKSSKSVTNKHGSMKAKLILKLPKIILKEPKLKINSVLDKSPEYKNEEPSVTIDLNMGYNPVVPSVENFKKLNEVVHKSKGISLKSKSKNKKKGNKHRKRNSLETQEKTPSELEEVLENLHSLNENDQAIKTGLVEDCSEIAKEMNVSSNKLEMDIKPSENSEIQEEKISSEIISKSESIHHFDDCHIIQISDSKELNNEEAKIQNISTQTNTLKTKSRTKSKKSKSKRKEIYLASPEIGPRIGLETKPVDTLEIPNFEQEKEDASNIPSKTSEIKGETEYCEFKEDEVDSKINMETKLSDEREMEFKSARTLRSSMSKLSESGKDFLSTESESQEIVCNLANGINENKNGSTVNFADLEISNKTDVYASPKQIEREQKSHKKSKKNRKHSASKREQELTKENSDELSPNSDNISDLKTSINPASISKSFELDSNPSFEASKIRLTEDHIGKISRKDKSENDCSDKINDQLDSDLTDSSNEVLIEEIEKQIAHLNSINEINFENDSIDSPNRNSVQGDLEVNIEKTIDKVDLVSEEQSAKHHKKSKKSKRNTRDVLPLIPKELNINDEITKNKEIEVDTEIHQHKRSKVKKTKKDKFMKETFVDFVTNENTPIKNDDQLASNEFEYETGEIRNVKSKSKKTKKERISETHSYVNETPSNEIETGIGKIKDAFEFEDDIMSIEDLSPKFKRKSFKITSNIQNEDITLPDFMVEGNISQENDSRADLSDSKKINESNKIFEDVSMIFNPPVDTKLDQTDAVGDFNSIRRQRSAKSRALENISIMEKNLEVLEKVCAIEEEEPNGKTLHKKKKESRNKDLKNMEIFDFDSLTSPRKNRAAKAKALENIKILEERPDDIRSEEKSKTEHQKIPSLNDSNEELGFLKNNNSATESDPSKIVESENVQNTDIKYSDNKKKKRKSKNRNNSIDTTDLELPQSFQKGEELPVIIKGDESDFLNSNNTVEKNDDQMVDSIENERACDDMELEDPTEVEPFQSTPNYYGGIAESEELPKSFSNELFSPRKHRAAKSKALENLNDLRGEIESSIIEEKVDNEKPRRPKSSKFDNDAKDISKNQKFEIHDKIKDCYDINKIDDDANLHSEAPIGFSVPKKKKSKPDHVSEINEIQESIFEKTEEIMKNTSKNKVAKTLSHDIEAINSLDVSLEKTVDEITSILGEKEENNSDYILDEQVNDMKHHNRKNGHKDKKNKKEVRKSEDTLLQTEDIDISNECNENGKSTDKLAKKDLDADEEVENKRRSRRACKVNTYNENELAEAIFLQVSAEKEKSKRKKTAPPTEQTQDKINTDELFDLLKATATENSNIQKPVEETFPDGIADLDDNFDDVFDDILKKSEALFREQKLTVDETSNASRSVDISELKSGRNSIQKTSESEEHPDSLYCDICKKSFKRIDNLVKHKTTLTHISKLSEIEAKQAEDRLRKVNDENESSKSNSEDVEKNNESDSLYSYPPTPGNEALKIAEIITNAFEKRHTDEFSEIPPPAPEYRRYKSLGERKSFESDQGSSNISENLDSNSYEPQISNNTGVMLQKQLTLLQNIIENKNLDYIDDMSMSSYHSLDHSNPALKIDERNDSSFQTNKNALDKKNDNETFFKPPLIEDISEDSLNLKISEDIKSRKVLNRDEELFLECCSLLKSGSEVSNFSKKSNKTTVNNIALKMSDEPDMFESKNLIENANDESSDYSRIATPLGDSFGDTSNSNTISSSWGLSKEQDVQEENDVNFKNRKDGKDEGSSHSSKFKSMVSKAMKMPFKNVSKLIKSRKTSTSDEDKDAASDCSSKMPTKGALKIFEGLKVSIPTNELDLDEVFNHHAKKIEAEKTSENHFLSPKTPKSSRKSKPIKNKQQIDDRFLFKVKRKSPHKDDEKSKIDPETSDKINDVYDFEETQDNTEVFAKPDFKTFKKDSENENTLENNIAGPALSSSSSSMNSNSKKPKTNECITKKKHMIMGRIFKNALKPKMDEEIKDLPVIDHTELVENYVLSCSPKLDDEFKKPKMTEEEMNYLFDKLLDKPPEEQKKSSHQSKTDSKGMSIRKKLKMKCKKRQRSNSDSTDDEFGLNKIVKKRPSRKNAKEEDNSINLEQELKECIGVASRKSQRKCTSGKQNVLVEYWSSDESAFEAFLENHLQELSAKTETPTKLENNVEKPEKVKKVEIPRKSTEKIEKDPKIKKKSKVLTKKKTLPHETSDLTQLSTQQNRRKRTAAHPLYHWSSSSEDEAQDLIEVKSIRDDPDDEYDEDRPIQHGWIVGDSPKKLVTMLAQAKGKKTEPESSVKEQGKKKNSSS